MLEKYRLGMYKPNKKLSSSLMVLQHYTIRKGIICLLAIFESFRLRRPELLTYLGFQEILGKKHMHFMQKF